jgi:hypothetical protein
MEKRTRVCDYYGVSHDAGESFAGRFDHPFLVMIQNGGDGDPDSEESYVTIKMDEDKLAELTAIASGRILNPDALVFPVRKRTDYQKGAGIITVGRASNCDVILPSKVISKLHLYLSARPCSEDKYLLADSGSTNGTQINGVPLEPHERVTIESRDAIQLGGEVTLLFFVSRDFFQALQRIPAFCQERISVS